MAYWHMDRARYYASVGDDARALRHLSKFGEVEEAAHINANEHTTCLGELTKSKEENARLKDTLDPKSLLGRQYVARHCPGVPRADKNGGCSVM